MPTIVNSAPMYIGLGINDKSAAVPEVKRQEIAMFLPKEYFFAQKGPLSEELCSGAGAASLYGQDTFDERKKYATHTTAMANEIFAAAGSVMCKRLVPTDAGPKANFCLWLDVLETDIPLYQRDSSGAYIRDALTGLPKRKIGNPTVKGYKAKWVTTSSNSGTALTADSDLYAKRTSSPGDQFGTNLLGQSIQSTRYPIAEFWATSFGEDANNAGFRIWAPTANSSERVNSKLMNKIKCYPYRMAAIKRPDANSTPSIVSKVDGASSLEFVLAQGQINPFINSECSLTDVFKNAWQKTHNPGYVPVYADLGNLHVYSAYLETLVTKFFNTEMTYLTDNAQDSIGLDFVSSDQSYRYLFNVISGVSTQNVPYNTFVMNNDDANAITLNESTNVYAGGGSDGTMDNAMLNKLVSAELTRYGDQNSPLQETAIHVESTLIDSGFDLPTKLKFCNVLAYRKDTNVILSTYDVDGPELTESDEASIGAALRTALSLFAESTYFGTPVTRGLVMARYGKLINSGLGIKLPYTFDFVRKAVRFAGAGDGKMKATYLFDTQPNNVVTRFEDINVSTVPSSQRNEDWANGINYPQPMDRDQFFYPGLKTVYDDDTSTLTSWFTMVICCELQKVGQRAWRAFTGNVHLKEPQLIKEVNKFVVNNTNGRFADLAVVIPKCTITNSDSKLGFAWTLPIQVYTNNSKTVMTLSVENYRMTQLPNKQ
jgi:hypothetical protein